MKKKLLIQVSNIDELTSLYFACRYVANKAPVLNQELKSIIEQMLNFNKDLEKTISSSVAKSLMEK
jgi:hypothetical protein